MFRRLFDLGAVIVMLFAMVGIPWRVYLLRSAAKLAADAADVGHLLRGRQVFPADDPWNTDISNEPVDENSSALIANIGAELNLHPSFGDTYYGDPIGISYVIVSGSQQKVPTTFPADAESDPGPYPIPLDAPVEGGPDAKGDRHVIAIDKDNWKLYELYRAFPNEHGDGWEAVSGAIFDLSRPSVQRPTGWTSADAAGLPIFAGLVRYDEAVSQGAIRHALRFTAERTRHGYVYPAGHFASDKTDVNLPPMGMRVRLKRDYDISGFPRTARVILQALKTYGMILADNGGNWYITGEHDLRWDAGDINTIKKIKGSAFEVVRMGQVVTTLKKIHDD